MGHDFPLDQAADGAAEGLVFLSVERARWRKIGQLRLV
jgi:hypothetical protein